MPSGKTRIALPIGDPAGIGAEICLKAALDPQVRAACDPIVICDPNVFARPWKEVATFHLHPEWQIQEYVCEENNHDYKALFEKYGGHD